MTIYKAL